MEQGMAFKCDNCGLGWESPEQAGECCAFCERILVLTGTSVTLCGKPRVWSSPPDSPYFPTGFCWSHVADDVRAERLAAM